MEDEKEHDESEDIPEKDATDEDDLIENEPSESESPKSDEPSPADESESQAGGSQNGKKSDPSSPKRGPRFRKQLLKRIPPINYPDMFDPKQLSMEFWIGKIMNLKASDYLDFYKDLF